MRSYKTWYLTLFDDKINIAKFASDFHFLVTPRLQMTHKENDRTKFLKNENKALQ